MTLYHGDCIATVATASSTLYERIVYVKVSANFVTGPKLLFWILCLSDVLSLRRRVRQLW